MDAFSLLRTTPFLSAQNPKVVFYRDDSPLPVLSSLVVLPLWKFIPFQRKVSKFVRCFPFPVRTNTHSPALSIEQSVSRVLSCFLFA